MTKILLIKLMDGCVLLRGLSNATNLRFRASFGMFNFKKDLEWCPMFHKLRTFYLVDWCLSGDLHALLSILQHTPNLQKITLQLCQKEKCALETEDCGPTEQPIELRQLKFFEIKCVKIDERVRRTSKIIFSALGTSNLKQFNIQII